MIGNQDLLENEAIKKIIELVGGEEKNILLNQLKILRVKKRDFTGVVSSQNMNYQMTYLPVNN